MNLPAARPVRAAEGAARKPVTLALQGGGAHGAFTWGVLDALLGDGRVDIRGVSGTSAGAMNGAMLVCGLVHGGPEAARAQLSDFWDRVAEKARFGPLQSTWLDGLNGPGSLDFAPGYHLLDLMSRAFSPYQLNFADFHPLREILHDLVDFDCLHAAADVPLFVTATNVRSGKLRVFSGQELSVDTLLASACLPTMHRAVEIDGEAYWDGGYTGNPAIFPLLDKCQAGDVVLVQINPLAIDRVPTSARDILDRVNEISFNSSLMREMRAIALITRLLEDGMIRPDSGLRTFHMHMIGAGEEMAGLSLSSKLNAGRDFLHWLRDLGRARTLAWLECHWDRVGQGSTLDVDEMFV